MRSCPARTGWVESGGMSASMLSAWPRRRGWFSNMARTTPSPDLGGVPGRVAGRAFDSAGLGLTDRRNDDGVPSQRRGAPVKEIAEGMEAPEHRTTLEAPGGRLAAFGNLWGSITGSCLGGLPGWDHR